MKIDRKIVIAIAFSMISCGNGGSDDPGLSVDGETGGEDVPGEDLHAEDETEQVPTVFENLSVQSAHGSIVVRIHRPEDCTVNQPCKALVLVPDKDHAGLDEFSCCASSLAQRVHSVVVTYNPPGRGSSGDKSGGAEDFGGPSAQDALKDVANAVIKNKYVDHAGFGIVSLGNGVADAAGAIARFKETALGFVSYFVDIEGPTNRCYVTQHPFYVDEAEGWYVNSDGPGLSATRCDFDLYPRTEKFPAGTSSDGKGKDGTPNAYVCNQNAFPIKQGGKPCGDDAWWGPREAKTYLKDISGVHYLRLQFLHDHEQPSRLASREAMRWIVQGAPAGYQMNNVSENNNLKGYGEEALVQAGAYLKYSLGNGFGTDIYDTVGDFKPVTKDELLTGVLPKFIERMQAK